MNRRRRRTDDSGTYGNTSGRSAPSETSRLRRSLRGGASAPLTREDRFEKLITYVSENTHRSRERTILTQFNMPSYVLASAQDVLQNKAHPSNLELLPIDILMDILNMLEGNEQIMASLACKTLASVAEASSTRKIANVTTYCWSLKNPYKLWRQEDGSTDAQFIRQGYAIPPTAKPIYTPWADTYYIPSYTEFEAANTQVKDLKEKIAAYLGNTYAWCSNCETFRLRTREWWLEFAEHESPEILKSKDAKKKVNEAIKAWNDKNIAKGAYRVCPAHALLEERKNGKRVVEEAAVPAKKSKPKKGKRKRKYEDSDTDSEL